MTGPKILLWDIETTQNVVAVFQLRKNDYIHPDNIIRERYIVCGAWKTLGDARIRTVSVLDDATRYKKDPHDDRHVVETLHKTVAGADVIVAHNGDAFDFKWLNARALKHGLPKLPPIKSIDTLKIARQHFLFNNNRLDYLGQFLGVGKKLPSHHGLWLRILQGDPKAVKEMVAYNKGDIALLEAVFEKLRPFVTESMNRHLFGEGHTACPRCGSAKIQARGLQRAVTRAYQRYQCLACGGWFRSNEILARTTTRLVA